MLTLLCYVLKWGIKYLEPLLLSRRQSGVNDDDAIRDVCIKVGCIDIDREMVDIDDLLDQGIHAVDLDHPFNLFEHDKRLALTFSCETMRNRSNRCLVIFRNASNSLDQILWPFIR